MPVKLKEKPFQVLAKNSLNQGYTGPYFFCMEGNHVQESFPEL
ncbi:hypothetical protein [Methanosarcina sp. 2.H.A.1B.4]|nr:hypothetical protein [Methanosarcina sp. 2.H.A.1B.4]